MDDGSRRWLPIEWRESKADRTVLEWLKRGLKTVALRMEGMQPELSLILPWTEVTTECRMVDGGMLEVLLTADDVAHTR